MKKNLKLLYVWGFKAVDSIVKYFKGFSLTIKTFNH